MNGALTVSRAGLLSTLQDRGRRGLRHLGIPWSGCLVPHWQQLANSLVGNVEDHCVIECWEGGLQLNVADNRVRFSIVADADAVMSLQSGKRKTRLASMRSYTASPGDIIALDGTGNFRQAVIAIAGLEASPQLGSVSTYAKAKLGGLNGCALSAGNTLSVSHSPEGPEFECTNPLISAYQHTEVRIVIGPQDNHFSSEGLNNLLTGVYTLGSDADRMGVRLSGPPVLHRDESAKNIVSDAIVPGSIQVPGNAQPIVLLSDAHTAGGYPKIATIISIDLPLLGIQRAGTQLRFQVISIDEAITATRRQHQRVQEAINARKPVNELSYTTQTLLATNLIDGVTDGDAS